MQGSVKWFDDAKSYGFITSDDGEDIFVHRSAIRRSPPYLGPEERVAFTVEPGQKIGSVQAANVTVLESE